MELIPDTFSVRPSITPVLSPQGRQKFFLIIYLGGTQCTTISYESHKLALMSYKNEIRMQRVNHSPAECIHKDQICVAAVALLLLLSVARLSKPWLQALGLLLQGGCGSWPGSR